MPTVSVRDNVEFECSNGGILRIVGGSKATDLSKVGVDGSFAYYDDLQIDSYNDLLIDVDEGYHVEGSVKHLTGDEVMSFKLSSLEPDSKADFKLTNLRPNSWYRLRFDGILAKCSGGRAHGRTNEHGILTFNEVVIPNE